MSRFRIEVAVRADDADLRRVLASTPMPGAVTVAFQREPSFFDAAVVDGGFHQIVIARDCEEARIAGFGTRSVRRRYVNGRPMAVGYLSALRLLPQYRNHGLLARGYRFFSQLHQDGRARFYLTTIAADNTTALSVLTSGRAGLPRYHLAGTYHTVIIPSVSDGVCASEGQSSVEIRQSKHDDLAAIIAFLHAAGPSRQFFPCYEMTDFFNAEGTFRDLKAQDLLVATRNGAVIGTLACWDQSAFRQTIVESYGAPIRWARPFYNGWAALRRRPKLPQPGKPFSFITAALPLVLDDEPQVFRALLSAAIELAAKRSEYLLIGMHESDPLLSIAKARRIAEYFTRLYLVCWPGGEALCQQLDDRPRYLELGCL
jgi:hypothetical protein